mgnify:CR=1 FL=1
MRNLRYEHYDSMKKVKMNHKLWQLKKTSIPEVLPIAIPEIIAKHLLPADEAQEASKYWSALSSPFNINGELTKATPMKNDVYFSVDTFIWQNKH